MKWKGTNGEAESLNKKVPISRNLRDLSPLIGPKGVKGLLSSGFPPTADIAVSLNAATEIGSTGQVSGNSVNVSNQNSICLPIYPSTYSAKNIDSKVWPQASRLPRATWAKTSCPDLENKPDLKPDNTFQALLHSYPHGLLAEDRRKRKTLSLSSSVEAQRFVFTSGSQRAAREDRFQCEGQSVYAEVRGDAAEIRTRHRRGAGDPLTWQTPSPTPPCRRDVGGLAMARLAELEEDGASAARYGAHALYPTRAQSRAAAAAAAAAADARASVPTPTWMPSAVQCCRASQMGPDQDFGASAFVAKAAAHAKKVEIEAQIVRLQERLRSLGEAGPGSESSRAGSSAGAVVTSEMHRPAAEAEAESARRQLALAKEALGLVREQSRLLARLSRAGPGPTPQLGSVPTAGTEALNTPSWPAGILDAESRARLAGLSRPELVHILSTAGVSNTLFGNEPLARLDPARLAALVASSSRARAAFLRLAPPPPIRPPPPARCASEMAGWLVAFDRGGRLRPARGGGSEARSRASRTARSLSPIAGSSGGGKGGAALGQLAAAMADSDRPAALDQAIFHGGEAAATG